MDKSSGLCDDRIDDKSVSKNVVKNVFQKVLDFGALGQIYNGERKIWTEKMNTDEERLVSTDGEENTPRVHARLYIGYIQMQGLLWKSF